MASAQKLYEKAKNSPNNLSFNELCSLVEVFGFKFDRWNGSHKIYKHPLISGLEGRINIQKVKGKAKPYQVRQVLDLIESFNLSGTFGE